jgi:hypothetical protein
MWTYAIANSAVVISKDEDFLFLANRPAPSARFIWVRLGNCRTKALLAAFESAWPKIESALAAGDRIVEIRWCLRRWSELGRICGMSATGASKLLTLAYPVANRGPIDSLQPLE